MFGIGWPEFLTIIVIAVIVIGPKDMPNALRGMGKLVRKFRETMRGFQDGVDGLAREAELEEITRQANAKGLGVPVEDIDPTADMLPLKTVSEKEEASDGE